MNITPLAWLIPAFAILEPVWMLTPFVGFLYGSVLNLSLLESHRATAWLLLFVLPARGIGLPGLLLTATGIALFAVGAGQVYGAKFFKQGMMIRGVYRYLRHPQYTGLILAAMGLVLLWSRFVAYISLFAMVFLYFLLARREEAACRERFGYAYAAYSRRTLGLFPGADALAGLADRAPRLALPVGLALTLALALGSGSAIIQARQAFSNGAPLVQTTVAWPGLKLPVLTPRMPYLEDGPRHRHLRFFMKTAQPGDFFAALQSSPRIGDQLRPFRDKGMNAIMPLFEPRLSVREENGRFFFSYCLVPLRCQPASATMGLHRFMETARVLGLLRIENMPAGNHADWDGTTIRVVSADEPERDPTARRRVETKVNILLSRF